LEIALLDSPSSPRGDKDVPKIPATAVAFLPDGWSLALGRADGTIILWDPAEAQEGPRLKSDAGAVRSLAVLAGGRLASLHENGTALLWDVSSWLKPPARALPAAQREKHWSALASPHGLDAFRAMGSLARDGKGGVAFLADKVKQAGGKMPSFKSLLDDLGGGSVLRQVYAKRELVGLGERAAPHLRHALNAAPPELKKRIQEALAEITAKTGKRIDEGDLGAPADLVRCSRALAVLARSGTAEARQALEGLARGASGTWLGDETRAALERLKRGVP
jgi:hypothetical protein